LLRPIFEGLGVEATGRSFRPTFEGLGVEALGDFAERSMGSEELRSWVPGLLGGRTPR